MIEDADAIDLELTAFSEQLSKLTADTEQLQSKLTDARQRQKSIAARVRTGHSRLSVKQQIHQYDTAESLHRFEQYERRLDRLEGELESYDIGRKGESAPSLADEIDALAADERIEAEFEALKARVSAQS